METYLLQGKFDEAKEEIDQLSKELEQLAPTQMKSVTIQLETLVKKYAAKE